MCFDAFLQTEIKLIMDIKGNIFDVLKLVKAYRVT